jgi:hypothetical protein
MSKYDSSSVCRLVGKNSHGRIQLLLGRLNYFVADTFPSSEPIHYILEINNAIEIEESVNYPICLP